MEQKDEREVHTMMQSLWPDEKITTTEDQIIVCEENEKLVGFIFIGIRKYVD